ncbi:uncharacterized protein LOC128164829 [Crassostrea angulata]|uniref:uncharacterized protein LOC128164829 n=1 Tax=Magallana angulata TaxID=2784310 RepID=UPI0022B1FE78|nr:uncharacterized protein LOC128164829 [Crassostrea angulata]
MATSIPVAVQHCLKCGALNCDEVCPFYCNPCHQRLCEECRNQNSTDTIGYDHQIPVEKCKLHPTRYADILCNECNIPLCSKCSTMKEHRGHTFNDPGETYAEKIEFCHYAISKIQRNHLQTYHHLIKRKDNDAEIRMLIDGIRQSVKTEAESLKEIVEKMTSDKLEYADAIEETLFKILKAQEKSFEDYIVYLEKNYRKFRDHLSVKNFKVLLLTSFENWVIQSIPDIKNPVPPIFTEGQFCKDDVAKLLGSIHFTDDKKGKAMETVSTRLKQNQKDKENHSLKLTMPLHSSLVRVRKYRVPVVDHVYHISLDNCGRFWVSDGSGNIVHMDARGNYLKNIKSSGRFEGHHTVTQDGNLIFADRKYKVIRIITLEYEITNFIRTGEWEPFSIHSSHINGDILVGMIKGREAKVTRYNKNGEEIQNIQRDNKGRELYRNPHYITENINGDICTSDYNKQAIVVVNKSGQHRFSHRLKAKFYPYGVCTDILGHIIVCNISTNTVHLLDQDGQFLSLLLTPQQGVDYPLSLCVNFENNLCVGRWNYTVEVYKYLF